MTTVDRRRLDDEARVRSLDRCNAATRSSLALVEVETLSQSGRSGVTVSASIGPDALMRQTTKARQHNMNTAQLDRTVIKRNGSVNIERTVVRRSGSVHVGIFRIGEVKRTWPLHFPGECFEAFDADGAHLSYRLRRADAVAEIENAWLGTEA
jgi:hypothetical protein